MLSDDGHFCDTEPGPGVRSGPIERPDARAAAGGQPDWDPVAQRDLNPGTDRERAPVAHENVPEPVGTPGRPPQGRASGSGLARSPGAGPIRLSAEDYRAIERLSARASRTSDIGRELRFSRAEWKAILETDETAVDAIDAGRGREHRELVDTLLRIARGELKATMPQVVSALFLLKSRHRYSETRSVVDVEIHGNVKVFEFQKPLDEQSYRRMLGLPEIIDVSKKTEK
jgi:hypothetical protein